MKMCLMIGSALMIRKYVLNIQRKVLFAPHRTNSSHVKNVLFHLEYSHEIFTSPYCFDTTDLDWLWDVI